MAHLEDEDMDGAPEDGKNALLPPGLARHPFVDELRRACESGQLVLFVGAGVSKAGGLPLWDELAERLIEEARQHVAGRPASSDAVAAVDEAAVYLARTRYIESLSAVRLALGDLAFHRAIERALDDTDRPLPDIAHAIAALASRLRAVLTTNLDRFLERALGWPMFARPVGGLAARQRYVGKLHGTREQYDTWVFTREQYDQAMFGSPMLQDYFRAMYAVFPMLFVGCSLDDDNLDQTLGRVRALAGAQPPAHYAILPRRVPPLRRRNLEAAGVQIIEYANADGQHGEVTAILRWLAA